MRDGKRFALGFAVAQLAVFGFAAAAVAQREHVVQAGDTLSAIAARYGAAVADLVRDNALPSADRIYIGQSLHLREVGGVGGAATGVGAAARHVVQRGETLSRIAARYGTTVDALVIHNGLASANLIWAGVELQIPGAIASATLPQPAPRRVHIDLSEQRLYAFEGDALVQAFAIATGSGQTPSPTGEFRVYRRLPRQDMSGPGYYAPDVPWVQYFSGSYALHGTYWHNSFGSGVSHGCINMRTPDAQWLYFWTDIGTPVSIAP